MEMIFSIRLNDLSHNVNQVILAPLKIMSMGGIKCRIPLLLPVCSMHRLTLTLLNTGKIKLDTLPCPLLRANHL